MGLLAECPLCHKEFKILLEKDELKNLAQRGIDSFIIEQGEEKNDLDENADEETESICPYCGQPSSSWWTQEQHSYINVFAKNIMAKIINEQLIRKLKKDFRGSTGGVFSVRFEGKEIEQHEPWMSPEVNDMEIFDLPCCQRKLKIGEGWNGAVHCFFCGFPHKQQSS